MTPETRKKIMAAMDTRLRAWYGGLSDEAKAKLNSFVLDAGFEKIRTLFLALMDAQKEAFELLDKDK